MVKKPWQQDAEERDKDSPKKKAKLTEFAGRHWWCDGRVMKLKRSLEFHQKKS